MSILIAFLSYTYITNSNWAISMSATIKKAAARDPSQALS
ncbi:hypothetical protein DSUL_150001 [Desulfovibrionales bacterium]